MQNEEVSQVPEGWVSRTNDEGRVYYFHKKTNRISWNLSEIQTKGKNAQPAAETQERKETKILTIEEARKVFFNLFREKEVTSDTKWEKVIQLLGNDDRFNSLPRMKDRKQVFKEYVESERQNFRKRLFDKKAQAKADFKQMLEEYKYINKDTKFQSLSQLFLLDPRWKALDEKERDECFQEYLHELFLRDTRNEKDTIRMHCENVKLKMLELKKVNSTTTWDEIRELMYSNPSWKELHEYYRLKTFSDFLINLRELEEKEAKKQLKLAQSNKRVDFMKYLVRLIRSDRFTFNSRYEDLVTKFKDDDTFYELLGEGEVSPRDIFGEFKDKLNQQHKAIKRSFQDFFLSRVENFPLKIDFETFSSVLKTSEHFKDFKARYPICNSFGYFSYYLFKKLCKRQQRAVSKLFFFFYEEGVNKSSSLSLLQSLMKKHGDSKYFESLSVKNQIEILEDYLSYSTMPEALKMKLEELGYSSRHQKDISPKKDRKNSESDYYESRSDRPPYENEDHEPGEVILPKRVKH